MCLLVGHMDFSWLERLLQGSVGDASRESMMGLNLLSGMAGMKRRQAGFTMIEMAIVLVVIGLILSAVMVGTDVQRSAEYGKIYQKFVAGWKQSYDLYYQRTGVVVGDSQTDPTFMVDGKVVVQKNTTGAQAGLPENYSNTGRRVCHGQGYARDSVGAGDPLVETEPAQDLHELMDSIGITMPTGRANGHEDRYLYLDSNGNPVELQICFQWNPDRTISGSGNVMVLRGLTPDLARYLDQLVDGKADALEGRFRQQNDQLNDTSSGRQASDNEWAANNTYRQGGRVSTGIGRGENNDEDRVKLLTGHWKMTQ